MEMNQKKSRMLADLLECPICMTIFEKPKALICQHSFCLQCIYKVYVDKVERGESKSQIMCPVCKKITAIIDPKEKLKKKLTKELFHSLLPNTFALVAMLDLYKQDLVSAQEESSASDQQQLSRMPSSWEQTSSVSSSSPEPGTCCKDQRAEAPPRPMKTPSNAKTKASSPHRSPSFIDLSTLSDTLSTSTSSDTSTPVDEFPTSSSTSKLKPSLRVCKQCEVKQSWICFRCKEKMCNDCFVLHLDMPGEHETWNIEDDTNAQEAACATEQKKIFSKDDYDDDDDDDDDEELEQKSKNSNNEPEWKYQTPENQLCRVAKSEAHLPITSSTYTESVKPSRSSPGSFKDLSQEAVWVVQQQQQQLQSSPDPPPPPIPPRLLPRVCLEKVLISKTFGSDTPRKVCVDSEGFIYVSFEEENRGIKKFSVKGSTVTEALRFANVPFVKDMALYAKQKRLFVISVYHQQGSNSHSNERNHLLQMYCSNTGKLLRTIHNFGTQICSYVSINWAVANELYVLNESTNKIQKFNYVTTQLIKETPLKIGTNATASIIQGKDIRCMTFSPTGILYLLATVNIGTGTTTTTKPILLSFKSIAHSREIVLVPVITSNLANPMDLIVGKKMIFIPDSGTNRVAVFYTKSGVEVKLKGSDCNLASTYGWRPKAICLNTTEDKLYILDAESKTVLITNISD